MFWPKKNDAPLREAEGPPPDELESALEATAEILRVLGRDAFDVGESSAPAIAHLFERWASHLLVLGRAPGDEHDEEEGGRRNWKKLVRFVRDHRAKERQHVVQKNARDARRHHDLRARHRRRSPRTGTNLEAAPGAHRPAADLGREQLARGAEGERAGRRRGGHASARAARAADPGAVARPARTPLADAGRSRAGEERRARPDALTKLQKSPRVRRGPRTNARSRDVPRATGLSRDGRRRSLQGGQRPPRPSRRGPRAARRRRHPHSRVPAAWRHGGALRRRGVRLPARRGGEGTPRCSPSA